MQQLSLPIKIIIAVSIWMVIGFLSGMSTTDSIQNWYVHLNKPFFNPPNWIFAPVWTILYIMMGVAAALVWHDMPAKKSKVKTALSLFVGQLILNALWSIIFFGMQKPMWALIEIAILWVLILLTIRHFNKINPLAGKLMIPYLLWVSFASILNASIWWLN